MLKKQMELIRQQQQELMIYDEAITHVANMRIGINLDDGVRHNLQFCFKMLSFLIKAQSL